MRLLSRLALSLTIAAGACSSPIDPGTAHLAGTVQTKDAATKVLGVNSGNVVCVTAPCFDYTVHVTGKVFEERADGTFQETTFDWIPNGARVLVWTTGVVMESLPAQVVATRVVVRYSDVPR
jgi:hypothetical protein